MDAAERPLIPATMLYRFTVDCRRFDGKWDSQCGFELDEAYRLPDFSHLDGERPFADVRGGWSAEGLWFTADVSGKQQTPWCRSTQVLDSDGLSLWIDTRDTHNIHRASRWCHWFVCLPAGGGTGRNQPFASMLKINRAREFPRTFSGFKMSCASSIRADGYSLAVHIPSASLDGWNADEHRRIGFNYALRDRERGWQTLAIGPDYPIAEDPALWQTLQLVE